LGAITRKGGLGMPVVISVVMFIIYYIINNTGYKMAREALWPCWAGMWLSSFVLLPIGIFLTYKAATDSALFNPEAWMKILGKLKRFIYKIWIQLRKHLKTSAKENS
jgi:lipopolysaccharide export system permease protein